VVPHSEEDRFIMLSVHLRMSKQLCILLCNLWFIVMVSCFLAEVHKWLNCWFQEFSAWSYCCHIFVGFRGIGTDSSTAGIANLCGYMEYEWSGLYQNIKSNMINFFLFMCYICFIKSLCVCVCVCVCVRARARVRVRACVRLRICMYVKS
jgi:hypothetical protein